MLATLESQLISAALSLSATSQREPSRFIRNRMYDRCWQPGTWIAVTRNSHLSQYCPSSRTDSNSQVTNLSPTLPWSGSVMHLANCTRPDIAQPVSRLAKFLKCPTTLHWAAAIHLLKYLAGTAATGIVYGQGTGLAGFCNADFAGDADTRRSTSGFVFLLNGGAFA